MRQMDIGEDELRDAIKEVVSLNPKPGNAVGGKMQAAMNKITPDFLVDTYNGEVTIQLNNSNIPSLLSLIHIFGIQLDSPFKVVNLIR